MVARFQLEKKHNSGLSFFFDEFSFNIVRSLFQTRWANADSLKEKSIWSGIVKWRGLAVNCLASCKGS